MDAPIQLDASISEVVAALKARYQADLPVLAPTETDRRLLAADMVNPDVDLGAYQHPIVLTLIAARDPFASTAMAASARLMRDAGSVKLIEAMARLVGSISRHADVRGAVEIATRHRFHPMIVREVGTIAVKRVEDERKGAADGMSKLLSALRQGEPLPGDFASEFLKLTYAGNLSRPVLQNLLAGVVAAPSLRRQVTDSLVAKLQYFPRDLVMSLATHVARLPSDADLKRIKLKIEEVARPAGTKPAALTAVPALRSPRITAAPIAPPSEPVKPTPWSPQIKLTRSDVATGGYAAARG